MFRCRCRKLRRKGNGLDADDAQGRSKRRTRRCKTDYIIDDVDMTSETGALGAGPSSPEIRANKAPVVKIEGEKTRHGKSRCSRRRSAAWSPTTACRGPRRWGRARGVNTPPPVRITVGKNLGLHFAWFVYRGAGAVSIRAAADQDVGRHARRRELAVGAALAGAACPAGRPFTPPPRHSINPGTYVLRGRADDGALTGDDDVTVTVSR